MLKRKYEVPLQNLRKMQETSRFMLIRKAEVSLQKNAKTARFMLIRKLKDHLQKLRNIR